LMTVFPHPDDESFAAGGVLALHGLMPDVRCVSLCLTKGGKSGALEKVGLPSSRETRIREREYQAAGAVLGTDKSIIWDYGDQELARAGFENLVKRIAGAMKDERTDVVITYGPDGITGHPDHMVCSKAVMEAAGQAGVKRLFMVTAPKLLGKVFLRKKLLPITHGVDIRRVYGAKMLALKANASQMLISAEPMIWVGLIMRLYGREYFHLIHPPSELQDIQRGKKALLSGVPIFFRTTVPESSR